MVDILVKEWTFKLNPDEIIQLELIVEINYKIGL